MHTVELHILVAIAGTILVILLWMAATGCQSGRKTKRNTGTPLKAKPRREFSKCACAVISTILVLVGIWMIWRYFELVQLAIERDSGALPDAALPIAGITAIVAPFVSYLLYQAGLKNSRNKYGVDAEGQPYKKTLDGTDTLDEPPVDGFGGEG